GVHSLPTSLLSGFRSNPECVGSLPETWTEQECSTSELTPVALSDCCCDGNCSMELERSREVNVGSPWGNCEVSARISSAMVGRMGPSLVIIVSLVIASLVVSSLTVATLVIVNPNKAAWFGAGEIAGLPIAVAILDP